MQGDYTQDHLGRLEIAIAPNPTGEPFLEISGTAAIDGRIQLVTGSQKPSIGTVYKIMSANAISGEFISTSTAPPFEILYGLDYISVVITQSPADFNGDGLVNGTDLGLLLSAWGTDDPVADLNGDGVVNGADLGLLLSQWHS